jgi:Trk K+ transport system NAD-binding subunit
MGNKKSFLKFGESLTERSIKMERAIYEVVCMNDKGERYSICPISVDHPGAESVIKEAKESGQYKEGDTIISVNALHEGGCFSADSDVMGLLITIDSLQEAARDALDGVDKPSATQLMRASDLVRLIEEKADEAGKLLGGMIEDIVCAEPEKPVLRLVEKR